VCDVAQSLQVVLEEAMFALVNVVAERIGGDALVLAGGVALNCVCNGRLAREGPFRRLFVPPAAGDAGGAMGAAALAHVALVGRRPRAGPLRHAFWGPTGALDDVAALVRVASPAFDDYRGREADLLDAVAGRLAAGNAVGWCQGRMEFGPRALGGRSILADPRRPEMRDRINAAVKLRETFRPFAPAVLAARATEFFDLDHSSPFMLETCQVRSPVPLPAVTHVDGSARVQTVDPADSPRFARLLAAFAARTGCPILLNTSFNRRGEPIVATALDALACFLSSELDCLVLDDFLLDRANVPPVWRSWFGGKYEPGLPAVRSDAYTLF
jgi:carbamoyltransferase